ncbi:uncharacterized protein ARMOST_15350 [Armillaria ostoyae]|uniref:Uncharacterized protein n=1 Tax=Armillaria ostoyae TaxID=47428 RepID=A0A284RT43_ARMOS|nr:uncharacterized protein ARMOST_15350 [Armillaria ostoyae]
MTSPYPSMNGYLTACPCFVHTNIGGVGVVQTSPGYVLDLGIALTYGLTAVHRVVLNSDEQQRYVFAVRNRTTAMGDIRRTHGWHIIGSMQRPKAPICARFAMGTTKAVLALKTV